MPNGAVALQLLVPEIPVAKTAIAPPGPTEVEITIGTAVADATTMLCQATLEHRQTGVLDPEIKDTVANRIARVAGLQLDHEAGDADFIRTAHQAGRHVLRRYFTDHCHSAVEADAAIDVAIDSVFEIVTRVVKDERVFRAAWAN